MANIETNIPQLDNLLNGGLEQGTLCCLWVKPGLDGTPFTYQIADAASKTTEVYYIINSRNPASAKEDMKSFGFKPEKILFIDSYSALIGVKPASGLMIADPKNVDKIVDSISDLTKKAVNPLIILDSLSTLVDLTGQENTDFLVKIKKLKATVLCLFTEWFYKPDFIKNLKDAFETIIEAKLVEEKIFYKQYFKVIKHTSRVEKQAIPYRAMKPGGIKIYIPKILVTGPFNSGKTSFIHSASERAVSVDRLGTTIALDHGHVRYKDFAVDLFGTPGQQRFDPILKLLGGEALGVVVMVSAVDPRTFPRALEMLKKAKVYSLPVVVAANKANLRGALTPQQVKDRMGLKEVDVIPVTAKDLTKVQPGLPCQLKQDDIEKVLDALFNRLMKEGLK